MRSAPIHEANYSSAGVAMLSKGLAQESPYERKLRKNREWKERNKEKAKKIYKDWVLKNPDKRIKSQRVHAKTDKRRSYFRQWEKDHPESCFEYKLKALKDDDSLFPTFYSLDSKAGYEKEIISNQLQPDQMLMMKEEYEVA